MSKARAKGTAWETAIVNYLRSRGVAHAERRSLSGKADRGDIAGIPSVVWEAKATKGLTLSEFMAEAEVERLNDKAAYGAVIYKRRMKKVSDAAVILPLWQFVDLLKQAEIIG